MGEFEDFLKQTGSEQDNQDDPFAYLNETPEQGTPAEAAPEEAPAEDDGLKPRNRRERRLEAKLQAERESSIELAARLNALEEARQVKTEGADYLKAVERIYGTESPEAREATELLKTTLQSVKEAAKREALEVFEEKRVAETKAVSDAEAMLDTMVEEIEDEFDVDLTSPEAEKIRVGFYKALEKMSPKDRDGNILYYADHMSVWEDYQERLKPKVDTTARHLANRSMTQGSATTKTDLTTDTNERYLREHGII
jgi:hypothetical protein